ncbi:UPF0182 family protein [Methylococcus sp. EFPC2]|uniref:UPF0182 family protein n=1 Tax=Methylococcus sp. EFPC2 TaxID=2812648 RepID=UPI0019677D71|nr:UPF0182 family protein [Methylococcus sp. EFPC2]QSA96722.1 UPF0182 family protein [Methylococcus sp. EFPC2]
MRNWKRLLATTAAILTALVALVLGAGILLTDFLVDLWWFSSLEYGGYFWLRLLYRYILSGGVTVFFFLIFFLNFQVASRFLGVDQSVFYREEVGTLMRLAQTGSMRLYIPLSLVLAIAIAAPLYQHWEEGLLFLFGPASEISDPVYNQNISFFLFSLPIFELIQRELFGSFTLLTAWIGVLYWLEHRMVPGEHRPWAVGAKLHLSGLVFITALITAWGYILQRHGLLYVGDHEPIFFGPGLVELRYTLPLLWVSAGALVVGAACGIAFVQSGRALRGMLASVVVFAVAGGLLRLNVIPELLDRFVVKPNPVKVEKSFMENNIKATLAAYDLTDIKTIDFTASSSDLRIVDPHTREHLHNIPIWDPEYLDDVYQQLQGIRPYYNFTDVDVGRYQIKGQEEQVNLAAREINIERLPKEARNWENRHLRYTHGFGAVITPASQTGENPMQWFLRDLSLQSDVGLGVEKPDIYFGMENLDYAIVPNRLKIVDISSFDQDSSQNYTGKGGIPISSLFRKLIMALHLRDEKLFFSVNIDSDSKLLLRRNVVDRIQNLTPFLALDNDPYIVVTPKRIYWVQDAYTTSRWYPVSKTSRFAFNKDRKAREFNYIRNSVKVVVDAFDGTVDYYVADPSDPIILGYGKAYPGLFKSLAELPPLLREQVRYPKDMFQIQMGIYAKYHQTQPELFYQQAETWDFAKVGDKIVKPYYITTYLEGAPEMEEFTLLNPMTPIGRNNLSVLGVAGSYRTDAGRSYNKHVVLYKFSRDVQVEGPSQVSALIDQDPEIARTFALWDQKGSHVQRGRIIMLPIGKSLLYVQPVYIVSTANIKIPELARVILSLGNIVVMETSLEKALDRLEARLQALKISSPAPSPQPETKPQPSMRPLP